MTEFAVAVEQLGPESEHHSFQGSAEWWAARDDQERDDWQRVERPFRFEIDVSQVGQDILVAGNFAGDLELECSRCAKRYSQALRDDFRLLLSPASGRQAPPPESLDPEGARGLAESGICLGEELEAGWFKGPVIRLGDFFGELVAMSIPLQPLCDSECPGICAHCGVDLTEMRCDCVDEKIGSPFAVLAELKSEQGE